MTPLGAPLGVSGSYPCTHLKTVGSTETSHRARFWRYPDGSWELLAVKMPEPVDCARVGGSKTWGVKIIDTRTGSVLLLPRNRSMYRDVEGVVRESAPFRCNALALCLQILKQSENARRAAVKCRRLARANSMRYMTTLTFPSSVPAGRLVRVRLFQRFIKYYRASGVSDQSMGRRWYPDGYLMFPELHKSGATHLHILHSNRIAAVFMRSAWTDYLTRACGYILPIGTNFVRTHEKDWGSAREAALYASKYVSKDFTANTREHGQRRYYPSLGLSDGCVFLECPPLQSVIARFGMSQIRSFSVPDDYIQWFYCAGSSRPPDLSAWTPWESVN